VTATARKNGQRVENFEARIFDLAGSCASARGSTVLNIYNNCPFADSGNSFSSGEVRFMVTSGDYLVIVTDGNSYDTKTVSVRNCQAKQVQVNLKS
jgi:hypothetical protein